MFFTDPIRLFQKFDVPKKSFLILDHTWENKLKHFFLIIVKIKPVHSVKNINQARQDFLS
jgi:hypothetical protein